MPFGFNNNKVDNINKEDFIEKKIISDKPKTNKSIKSDDGNRFRVKSYTKDKNPKKYKTSSRDDSLSPDMSWYYKPWHLLTPSQRIARSDMDSIMDY